MATTAQFPGTSAELAAFEALEQRCGCEPATTWKVAIPCAFHLAIAGPDGARLLVGLVCSRRRAAEMVFQEGIVAV